MILNILLSGALLFSLAVSAAGELQRVSCVMHLHSTFSSRKHTPLADIVAEARRNGIDAVIPTDHDIMRWEYGLPPLRRITKIVHDESSVLTVGPEKYLAEIRRLRETNPDIVIIPGVESSPFYYWTGNPFRRDLVLNDWHKHLLVVGLERPEDYRRLPLVSNRGAGDLSPVRLWPLALAAAAFLLRRRRALAFILGGAGVLLLVNNYPFRDFTIDAYHGPRGEGPYQRLIDYSRARGALTFWAHPEAANWEQPVRVGPVSIATRPYPESISATRGQTGFAVLAEGDRRCGAPGGIWDDTLNEYRSGRRGDPVWAAGELDFGESSADYIGGIRNILWVKEKDRANVLESLGNGRFYVLRRVKDRGLEVRDFAVSSGEERTVCGGTIDYDGPPRIRLSLASSDGGTLPVKVSIVRDGKLVKIIEADTPVELIYEDTTILAPEKHYYRVTAEGKYPHHIVFNPVFLNGPGMRRTYNR